ncbi:MAG: hypothetical protein C0406_03695, partial [Sideroxydans sp.]|nr:hypothetical protein [Sideroxydans sp.]
MLYAFDLMAKRDYRIMTLAERGLLLSMWCECWANKELPSNKMELGALLGKPDVENTFTPRVLNFFETTKSGTLISPDLESYREKVLAQRAGMSEGGKKGGRRRVENERKSREVSSPPSTITQATLNGCESESESEKQSLVTATTPDDDWV